MKNNLDIELSQYSKSNKYPFHMPGHKRSLEIYGSQMDITEIEGFDNLAEPKELLADLEKDFAKAYNSEHTHLLVNGSTVGNLAAVYSLKDRGDILLIGRNCHKSVYNAARVAGLELKYFYPELDENGICQPVTADMIEQVIEEIVSDEQESGEKTIAGLVITSPTYEGYLSDIENIAKMLHQKNIPLVVDAAHGAHLKFVEQEGMGQEVAYADLTIMSLHKTLPTLNQGAILHVNSHLIDDQLVKENINIFQTSSPSYVIMASAAKTCGFIIEKPELFVEYQNLLMDFYEKSKKLSAFTLLDAANKDQGKLVIICNKEGYGGYDLLEELDKKYDLILEMASNHYAIAMTSIMDSQQAFNRLYLALNEIDNRLKDYPARVKIRKQLPKAVFSDGQGSVAEKDIYAYPPGSPIVAKGEVITQEARDFMKEITGE